MDRIYRIDYFKLSRMLTMDRIAGLQDLQDRVLGISWGLNMDRITGLQDLQDGLFKTKQGTNYGQDCRIYRIGCWA